MPAKTGDTNQTLMQKDPLGEALIEYLKLGNDSNIVVHSDISEDDIIPVSYLFREFDQMPDIEKRALSMCKGKTLDVGAGAGPHALWLQKNGINTTAIDTSQGAVKTMLERGVNDAENIDIKALKYRKYDTILLLMNGIGIAGKLTYIPKFLKHLNSLLNENGQVIIESTDIKYMFMEDDGSMWVDANKKYYGEVKYQMQYNDTKGEKFDWLFIDFNTLSDFAKKNGFKSELIVEGENHEYIAQLIKI